jgi:predicted transposase/invertase (TIGR01784 family)
MSLNPKTFEPLRLEYYESRLFAGQDIRGADKSFDDLKPAYQIAFLVNKTFYADDDFIHNFEYYDPERRVSLGGRSTIITLELPKLAGITEKSVTDMTSRERWAVFFRYLTDKTKRQKINDILDYEEGIEMASEVLMTISKDERERARLESEFKYALDTQSELVNARREGMREGKQEGMREGEKYARQQFLELLKSGKSPEELIQIYDGSR